MFDAPSAFKRLTQPAGGGNAASVSPAKSIVIPAGATFVEALTSGALYGISLTDGTNGYVSFLSYDAPDGCIFGDVGTPLNVTLLPSASGLQITNNSGAQVTLTYWRL